MKRGLSVTVVVLVVAVSAGAGWWLGRGIRSPAQIAAEAEPPEASLITVQVERTELSANVITRADVGYDDPAILSLGGSLGGVTGSLVVTAVPERGEELTEGEAVIEIAGRPVFLLEGPIPVFRDMRPGAVGPDVLQVEQSLVRLGFLSEEADQVWNDDTEAAVEAWYQDRGYQANGISEQEETALKTARNRVKTADDALRSARKALTDAEEGPTETQVRQARAAVASAEANWDGIDATVAASDAAARQTLEDAEQAVRDLEAGPTETQVRQARAAVASAEANWDGIDATVAASDAAARQTLEDAEQAVRDLEAGPSDTRVRQARDAVAAAERNLRNTESRTADEDAAAAAAVLDAERARETAARAYAEADSNQQSARMGVHPETGNVPTAGQLERLRLATEAARMQLEKAEKAITDARDALRERPMQAESDLRTARNGLLNAQDALDELLDPPDGEQRLEKARRAVADARAAVGRRPALAGIERDEARNRLLNAQDALDELLDPPDGEQRLEKARRAVADARAAVGRRPALAGIERDEARNRLLNAQDALDELLKPPDLTALQRQADESEADLETARNDLDKLEKEYGIWIPAGEVIFLKRTPVRVDAITSELGSRVSGGFMTVTGSDLAVRGSVLVRDVSLVGEGGEARIEDASLTEPIPGSIRLLENRPGTRNVASDRHYMEITATGEIPDDLVGKNVRIVIPVGGTAGEVWAVPAAALSATADGAVRVEIAGEDGSTRFVEVEPGLSAQGLVEVTPLDGEIAVGDRVVVGAASGE